MHGSIAQSLFYMNYCSLHIEYFSNSYKNLHLNSPLYALYLCQISRQSDCPLKSYSIFLEVCKIIILAPLTPSRRKKMKIKTPKFDYPYLMNDYCKLIKICFVVSPRWQAATMQISHAFLKGSWSYGWVNKVI